ncbi:MAG: hypothetical protein R3F65_13285 [bacterium]
MKSLPAVEHVDDPADPVSMHAVREFIGQDRHFNECGYMPEEGKKPLLSE